jgi:hypothetical protein
LGESVSAWRSERAKGFGESGVISIGARCGEAGDIAGSDERLEVDRDERLEVDLEESLEIDLGDSGSDGNRNLEDKDDNDGDRGGVGVRGEDNEGDEGDDSDPSRTTMSVKWRCFFNKRPET